MDAHYPVMLSEVLEYLAVRPDQVYVDCTTGLGGHSMEIAKRLTTGRLICLDADRESLEKAQQRLAEFGGRICFRQSRFSQLRQSLTDLGVDRVDGLLADLGVSRMQLTSAERGFSLMQDSPLDMRFDRSTGQTAEEIVNFSSEHELADLIYQLGQERRSRKIARAIVRARPVKTTVSLANVIEQAVPRAGKLHPATQTFMALRMYVNREIEELESLLEQVPAVMAPGGRAVFLSFHSGESGITKKSFQQWAREGRAELLTKHVVKPQQREVRENAASRSVTLRCAQWRGPASGPNEGSKRGAQTKQEER
ncbi:MAG: 16S rRNA (cytosine(1402)-N(4))-methyltransferase RsmH [Acidobacteriia bacterium]|nr:16S rRNA (cytosine(1402)-N(4))-methyltransferase RsmH [Terriglobia bacterium]